MSVTTPAQVFDTRLLAQRMKRHAKNRHAHDFLWRHGAAALQDRLLDIKRDFDHVVETSCGMADGAPYVLTPEFLTQKNIASPEHVSLLTDIFPHHDEAVEMMNFAPRSLDGFITLGEMQWINDVPGFLVQVQQALRPDGLFLGAFFGGDTLHELRDVLAQAEMQLYGGASPRVSPFISLQDMAALMQRAQFALPVADHDRVTVTYGDFKALVKDMRMMGQNNAVTKRNKAWRSRRFWDLVEDLYHRHYGNADGRLVATVEMIYVLGWAPDASQPQPLKRGSATHDLADILQRHATHKNDE